MFFIQWWKLCGKEENDHHEQFFFFQQCFQKLSAGKASNGVYIMVRIILYQEQLTFEDSAADGQ